MSDLLNMIYGPLNKEACGYFLFFSVVFFLLLIGGLIMSIAFLVRTPNKLDFKNTMHIVVLMCNLFLAYFVNRLLYTMCTKILV